MGLREELLQVCEKYQELAGVSESTLSNTLFSGGTRLREIREGGGLGIDKYEKALHWLTINWPRGHRGQWPRNARRVHTVMAIEPTARGNYSDADE